MRAAGQRKYYHNQYRSTIYRTCCVEFQKHLSLVVLFGFSVVASVFHIATACMVDPHTQYALIHVKSKRGYIV